MDDQAGEERQDAGPLGSHEGGEFDEVYVEEAGEFVQEVAVETPPGRGEVAFGGADAAGVGDVAVVSAQERGDGVQAFQLWAVLE